METEVVEKARRRGFTAEYKLRVLAEADRSTKPGEVGALLRREGLYSSLLSAWRRQRDAGELSARSPKKRGPQAQVPDASARRVAELEKELARAQVRLKRAEALLDLQKKFRKSWAWSCPSPTRSPDGRGTGGRRRNGRGAGVPGTGPAARHLLPAGSAPTRAGAQAQPTQGPPARATGRGALGAARAEIRGCRARGSLRAAPR
ncbi:transposase [Myxococcus sp. SDU36]|nr:transposase [Myxococcus sp. SDU36]